MLLCQLEQLKYVCLCLHKNGHSQQVIPCADLDKHHLRRKTRSSDFLNDTEVLFVRQTAPRCHHTAELSVTAGPTQQRIIGSLGPVQENKLLVLSTVILGGVSFFGGGRGDSNSILLSNGRLEVENCQHQELP